MSIFVHRQLLLGPVVLPLIDPDDEDGTTEDAYEDFDGMATCWFFVEAREGTPALWFTMEVDNKLRGELASGDPGMHWTVDDTDTRVSVRVDESDEPSKIVVDLPSVVTQALQVALDEYRALAVDPKAIVAKALARAKALALDGGLT